MFKVPENFRWINAPKPYNSTAEYGNNGIFVIPHQKIKNYTYNVIAGDGAEWEHVSVSLTNKKKAVKRCPTWEDMCFIKDLFWSKNARVVQYHPPEEEYVSHHHFTLHLWRNPNVKFPAPNPNLVGPKNSKP